jgi:diguanylate cyclase (GGDEF)-like protein
MIGGIPETDRPVELGNRSHHAFEKVIDVMAEPIVLFNKHLEMTCLNLAARSALKSVGDAEHLLVNALSVIHPDDVALVEATYFQVMAEPGIRVQTVIRFQSENGWKHIETHATNLLDDPEVGAIVASFRDVESTFVLSKALKTQVQLTDQNAALNDDLERREEFLRRLLRIQTSISHRAPLTSVLQAVVDGVVELLDVGIVSLLIREPTDENRLVIAACAGLPDDVTDRTRDQRVEDGLAGAAYMTNGPVLVDSYSDFDGRLAEFEFLGIHAAAAVPIRFGTQTIGSLAIGCKRPGRTFSDLEIEMLGTLSDHAGLALMDAQTLEAMTDAMSDPLTGLPDRQLLMDRLTQSLSRCRRDGSNVSVLFIDLDQFRTINNGRGHTVGDRVLQVVAKRLSAIVRGYDTIARLGGDAFVAILERATANDAADAARRIIAAVKEEIVIDDVAFSVGASVGIALDTDGTQSAGQLVEQADIAMYRAKAAPRCEPVFFEESMQAEVTQRTETERELRHAIKNGGIDIAYQPLGDLRTGFIYGVEALARWTSPTLGVVPPSIFVQLAEQTGNVVSLDRAVLRLALLGAMDLCDPVSGRPLTLNVNLSPQHLENDEVISDVAEALKSTGFPPRRLTLEITETDIMSDAVLGMERLVMLKELGVKIALDDFGTGHSSMAYLRQFPVDTLKIDRAFITNIANNDADPRAAHLVQAMIGLGHALGMQVLAEGVEHLSEAMLLRRMGLDLVQGYWLGRPATRDELPGRLEDAVAHLHTARSRSQSGRTATRVSGWGASSLGAMSRTTSSIKQGIKGQTP